MLLEEEQLRAVIAGRPVGDAWPYRGGTEQDIEEHLHRAVDALRETGLFTVDADFNHYGSGYASYVHIFCEKSGGRSRLRRDNTDWMSGIAIYLSRLTPFAAYGPEERTRSDTSGSFTYMGVEDLYALQEGDWNAEVSAIRRSFDLLGFVFPTKQQLEERLPFDVKIPTILDETHIYGAIFYWED